MTRSLFETLARRHPTPRSVQKLLRRLAYNQDSPETLRSARDTWNARRAHCLEAAFLAAAILEQRGYPPLVMSLESQDDLDHVVYVFRERTGWGAIGRSRDEGLHGRPPIFRSPRDLAWSYFEPYVDRTGRITAYGVANLDDAGAAWRDSPRNVWKAEQYLIDLAHIPLRSSDSRYRRLLRRYLEHGAHPRRPFWW
jgi:hypothetical protein